MLVKKKEEQSDLSKLDQMSFQNNFNQFPIPQKPVEMPAIKSSEITDGPTLVAVEGVDGDLRALVSETGRSVRKVRSGDKIGKWVVGNITMDSVTIKNGKEEKICISNMCLRRKMNHRSENLPVCLLEWANRLVWAQCRSGNRPGRDEVQE